MKERIITSNTYEKFTAHLKKEEKSCNTIKKYLRDIHAFGAFMSGKWITKEGVIAYKNKLLSQQYAPRSVNSMLASLNSLFAFLGWDSLKIRLLKLQRQIYSPEETMLTKAEYIKLVNTAKSIGNERLSLLLQTICATGIRVSEVAYITVEAVSHGKATVSLKGKTRCVFIIPQLQKKLLRYAKAKGIGSGAIFITRTGKPMNRTNIWREMKALCARAKIAPRKVFPHNLRHLFARTFYGMEKDIAKLADILGHSSINTTRIYIITTGNEHRKQLEHMHLII